ncbi:MAG: hypothetical protein RLZZ124_126 [Cyanobacteriota bacterium]|jgi:hypothetical protein
MNRWLQAALAATLLVLGWQNRGRVLGDVCSATLGQIVPGQRAASGFGQSWRAPDSLSGTNRSVDHGSAGARAMEARAANPVQDFCASLIQ